MVDDIALQKEMLLIIFRDRYSLLLRGFPLRFRLVLHHHLLTQFPLELPHGADSLFRVVI